MLEIDLRADLHPRHHPVFRALGLLSKAVNPDDWCLVGGLMVLVAARAIGQQLPRAELTKDGDVVVDVCTRPGVLSLTTSELRKFGYEPAPHSSSDSRLSSSTFFCRPISQLDILCPDGSPADELESVDGLFSIAIPGGTTALALAEKTRITYDDK